MKTLKNNILRDFTADISTFNHEQWVFTYPTIKNSKKRHELQRTAKRYFNGDDKSFEGLHGQSYAFPLYNEKGKFLPSLELKLAFMTMFSCAKENPHLNFMLNLPSVGFSDIEIAKTKAFLSTLDFPENVMRPGHYIMSNKLNPKIIIAGGRSFQNFNTLKTRCSNILSVILEHSESVTIVSGTAHGVDILGERFYREIKKDNPKLKLARMPANWDLWGKPAGFLRNGAMAWYGTHLIAFWNGNSPGTRSMISLAKSNKMISRIIAY